ncbi:hypothetical protein M0P48_02360 [Candidatus Gracilibacteria bacterium]|nr:hypothetical protein [Candidatus Gracilibacteria bacterium]
MIRKNCSVSSSAFYTEQDKRWLQNRKDEGMSKEEAFKILDGIKEELEPKNQSKAEIEEEQLSRYKKCLSDEGLKE